MEVAWRIFEGLWEKRLMYKPQDLNWMPITHVRFGYGSACVLQSSTWDQAEVFVLLKAFLNKSLPEESLCWVWLLEDTLIGSGSFQYSTQWSGVHLWRRQRGVPCLVRKYQNYSGKRKSQISMWGISVCVCRGWRVAVSLQTPGPAESQCIEERKQSGSTWFSRWRWFKTLSLTLDGYF